MSKVTSGALQKRVEELGWLLEGLEEVQGELYEVLTEGHPGEVKGHNELEMTNIDKDLSMYQGIVAKPKKAMEETVGVLARLEDVVEDKEGYSFTAGIWRWSP